MLCSPEVGRREATMNMGRLTRGEQIILVSGIALLVVSFFGWLGARISRVNLAGTTKSFGVTQYSFTHNAWGYTVTLVAVLMGVAMVAYVTLKLLGVAVPPRFPPWSAGQVMLGLGTISLVLVLTKLIVGARADLMSFGLPTLPSNVSPTIQIGIHKSRDFGAFAGVAAAGGLCIGGFLNRRDERRNVDG